MKKLSLLKLEELAHSMPVLDETDQRNVVGGAGSPPPGAATGTYTFEQMEVMIDNGTWSGGIVSGVGYVLPSSIATGAYTPPPTGYYDLESENDPTRPSGSSGVWQNPYNPPSSGGGGGSSPSGPPSSNPPDKIDFSEGSLSEFVEWFKYIKDHKGFAVDLKDMIDIELAIQNGFIYSNGMNGGRYTKNYQLNGEAFSINILDSTGFGYPDQNGFNEINEFHYGNAGSESKPIYYIELRNANCSVIRISFYGNKNAFDQFKRMINLK